MSHLAFQRSEPAILFSLVIFALTAPNFVSAQNTGSGAQRPLDLTTVVSRMEQARSANMAGFKAYSSIREYNLYGSSEADRKSHVVARVNFVPPAQKDYAIEQVEGSDRGATIARHILETESEAAQKANSTGAVIPSNYNFALLGQSTLDGHPVYVLRIKPKHQETALIDGVAYVDQSSFLVRRMDGDLAKSPSWWIKKIHTVVDFGDEQGMWLQKSSRSTAQIRIIGPHIFTGKMVSLSTAEQSAGSSNPKMSQTQNTGSRPNLRHRRSTAPPAVLGTGVLGR